MQTDYPNVDVYKYNLYFTALEHLNLPGYQGSMFRGAFGHAFKKVSCSIKLDSCQSCLLKTECVYFSIFETELEENNIPYLDSVRKIPHPFLIQPDPKGRTEYKKNEMLKLGLTIFGSKVKALPYFIYAFDQMGKHGISGRRSKVHLVHVESVGVNKSVSIYNSTDAVLSGESLRIALEDIDVADDVKNAKSITLDFLTPFRVQEKNKVMTKAEQLTPLFLIRTIERRLYALATLFCNNRSEYKEIEYNNDLVFRINNLKYFSWQRYSSRQNAKIGLGGYKGSLVLTGNLSKYYKLFKGGELINIGKNTAFGLGYYKLTVVGS